VTDGNPRDIRDRVEGTGLAGERDAQVASARTGLGMELDRDRDEHNHQRDGSIHDE
jgi:hypothetical protein